MTNTHKRGFTLIELLIVVGIIAALAAIVIVAVNPARQFSKANDAQRIANVSAISSAVAQYVVDNRGELPGDISTTLQDIDTDNANLCDDLVPTYMPALPTDPSSTHKGAGIKDCDDASYDTDYTIERDTDNRITVSAPGTELGDDISVTR